MSIRALYIPHGGGPMPLMGSSHDAELVAYLREVESHAGRPSAIILISAHWEETTPTITAHPNPDLLFDYYGFPDAAYEYTYPAPGSVDLANRCASALADAGMQPQLDNDRGFDHGMFVPMMLMYPDASIPVVQVSLVRGLDAASHVALGEALRGALDDDMMIIGSGMSFHNQQQFGNPDPSYLAFDEWLDTTCTGDIAESQRRQMLVDWQNAPGARASHPREEHLIPLHVCYGLAGTPATRTFDGSAMGVKIAAYAWD